MPEVLDRAGNPGQRVPRFAEAGYGPERREQQVAPERHQGPADRRPLEPASRRFDPGYQVAEHQHPDHHQARAAGNEGRVVVPTWEKTERHGAATQEGGPGRMVAPRGQVMPAHGRQHDGDGHAEEGHQPAPAAVIRGREPRQPEQRDREIDRAKQRKIQRRDARVQLPPTQSLGERPMNRPAKAGPEGVGGHVEQGRKPSRHELLEDLDAEAQRKPGQQGPAPLRKRHEESERDEEGHVGDQVGCRREPDEAERRGPAELEGNQGDDRDHQGKVPGDGHAKAEL